MPRTIIWDKATLSRILQNFFSDSIRAAGAGYIQLRLDFTHNSTNLFEYAGSTDQVVIKATNDADKKDILDALDRSGAWDLSTTIMPLTTSARFAMRSTNVPRWSDWFMRTIGSPEGLFLIPDTNILMRHYCSNALFRRLGEANFGRLHFRLPRLDILEIERKVNQSRRGSKEKRVALFATTEVMFLREHGADLLPPVDISLLTGFSEKAGTQFVDAWIRREIHDFIKRPMVEPGNVLFLTCDLMNALAAHAEGIRTCYFSKLDQEKFSVEATPNEAEELAEFLLNASITFEKIRMDVYLVRNRLHSSYELEGMWSGKTPFHWSNDCLRVTRL